MEMKWDMGSTHENKHKKLFVFVRKFIRTASSSGIYTRKYSEKNYILLAFVRKVIPKASRIGIYTRKYAEKMKFYLPLPENLYKVKAEGSLCTFIPVRNVHTRIPMLLYEYLTKQRCYNNNNNNNNNIIKIRRVGEMKFYTSPNVKSQASRQTYGEYDVLLIQDVPLLHQLQQFYITCSFVRLLDTTSFMVCGFVL
jgi:hypothetical protein